MAQIGNMFACRTETNRGRALGWFSNPALFAAGGGALAILLAIVYLPPLDRLFQHVPIPPVVWVWLAIYPLVIYGFDWLRKQMLRRKINGRTKRNYIDSSFQDSAVKEAK